MVEDENNLPEARDALQEGLQEGLFELYEETLRQLDSNMREGKDALGNKWVPITEETLFNSREVRTMNRDALVDTGALRGDILGQGSEFDRKQLVAIIGTTLEHAPPHEFGWPEKGIPRRPFLAPAATYAERHAEEIIGREIDTRIEATRL